MNEKPNRKFKKWLRVHGFSISSFALLSKCSKSVIKNLVDGKFANLKTVKKIIKPTRRMPQPLEVSMFRITKKLRKRK